MSSSVSIAALAGICAGIACASTPAPADGPGTAWRSGAILPRAARDAGVTALGLDVVVAGGFTQDSAAGLTVTSRVDLLDTATGDWLPAGTLPDAPVRWTAINLAAVGATLYLLGGLDGADRTAHGESYALDPLDHTWQALPALPPGYERGAAGVVVTTGRIYLLGGIASTGPVATCLEYDVPTRTWALLPSLPEPRAWPAAMRRADGTLIVAGGLGSLDASDPRGEVWSLPPAGAASRSWTPRAAMHPPGAADPGGGCAYGAVLGQLVCAGGAAAAGARASVASYDPYNDVWTVREAMPAGRAGVPGAAIGGRLYVPGGAGAQGEPTDTLYVYTPLDTQP